jgi:hypothetical protein
MAFGGALLGLFAAVTALGQARLFEEGVMRPYMSANGWNDFLR